MNKSKRVVTVRKPMLNGPLAGLTILLVEDSNLTSEEMRLMCLHSGARLRRADSLATAYQHLGKYRPDVIIVDLGLPDGSGTSIISDLFRSSANHPIVILGLSGDPEAMDRALVAGAVGFLEKPLPGIKTFQTLILSAVRGGCRRPVHSKMGEVQNRTDALALREDLERALDLLQNKPHARYAAQLLRGVARSIYDKSLESAAQMVLSYSEDGDGNQGAIDTLIEMAHKRVARLGVI